MAAILQNRARISQTLQEETENTAISLKSHAQIAHIKEIILSLQKGQDPNRIGREFSVDLSLVQKLSGYYAVPVDNADGIVSRPRVIYRLFDICFANANRVNGPVKSEKYAYKGAILGYPTQKAFSGE